MMATHHILQWSIKHSPIGQVLTICIKFPHLGAHLHKEVDHGGGGAEGYAGVLSHSATHDLLAPRPEFLNLSPDAGVLNLLGEVGAGADLEKERKKRGVRRWRIQ